jgi:hypothetical protein
VNNEHVFAYMPPSYQGAYAIPNGIRQIVGGAFYECSSLTSVTIPNSVTSIGESAFSGCKSLTSVTIGKSVTSIGESAFSGCKSLTSVTIGKSVTSIGNYAFSRCESLTSITCKASTPPACQSEAFKDVKYSLELYVPKGYRENYKRVKPWSGFSIIAISPQSELEDFIYAGDETTHTESTTINGITYSFTKGGSTAVVSSGKKCSGNVIIPTTIKYTHDSITETYSVTSIGGGAFAQNSSLTGITIPKSVISIGKAAFYGCGSLRGVTIPNSVTSIGEGAFASCYTLQKIMVDESNPFFSSLDGVLYNKGKTKLIQCPGGKQSHSIYLYTTSIEDYAFLGCTGLTSISIPNRVTSVGKAAFANCAGLRNVSISNSVTSLGEYAFQNCSGIGVIVLHNSLTNIGDGAFSGCAGLSDLTIGENVRSIGDLAFQGCSGLSDVTIPDKTSTIGFGAFRNCLGLTSITCKAYTPPTCKSRVFDGVDQSLVIYVPEGSVQKYKNKPQWSQFKIMTK